MPLKKKKPPVQISLRLDPAEDQDLISVLDNLTSHYGAKTAEIKAALRRGFGLDGEGSDRQSGDTAAGGEVTLNAVTLIHIQQIVENAVSAGLEGKVFPTPGNQIPASSGGETNEVKAEVENMMERFMSDDE